MLHHIRLQIKQYLLRFNHKQNQVLPLETQELLPPLNERDLEFLFRQLLEGVYQGKSQFWANQWLLSLEKRVTTEHWLVWLNGFGEKLLASASPNTELATKMIKLGEVGCREIGKVAHKIGRQLLTMQSERIELNLTTTVEQKKLPNSLAEKLAAMLAEDFWLVNQDEVEVNLAAPTNQYINLQPTNTNKPIALLKPGKESQRVTSPEFWNNQGAVLKNLGELEQAISSFDQAITLRQNYHQAWYNRGVALFEKAFKFPPKYHQDAEDVSLALFNVGCLQESLASFSQALEIKPDYQQAKTSREQILAYYQQVKSLSC